MTDENADQSVSNAAPPFGEVSAAPAAAPKVPTPEELKAAFVAFKKRWKLTRLDYESRLGRSPLSAGGRSAIVGIEAPREYPRAVWDELVKQGRIKSAGKGLYSMP